MSAKMKNPYLYGADRLADVLAAIQFLGTYKFYKVGFDYWLQRIKEGPKSTESWETIFREHPEFFRVSDSEKNVCLFLRRARQKNFHVDTEETLTKQERDSLSAKEKKRVTRAPLTTGEVATLMDAAIELHARSMAHQQERRWFLPLLAACIGLAGVVVGAVLGALLKSST